MKQKTVLPTNEYKNCQVDAQEGGRLLQKTLKQGKIVTVQRIKKLGDSDKKNQGPMMV